MNIRYDSTELIDMVRLDIQELGKQTKVYAIYSLFPEIDRLFITDYIFVEKPKRDGYMTDEEYQDLVDKYERRLKTLNKTKHELMSLDKLLDCLQEQNKLI